MTDSTYTLTDMTGQVQLAVQLDRGDPEPVTRTCERAVADLTEQGLIPSDITILDISATGQLDSTLHCTISWTLISPRDQL